MVVRRGVVVVVDCLNEVLGAAEHRIVEVRVDVPGSRPVDVVAVVADLVLEGVIEAADRSHRRVDVDVLALHLVGQDDVVLLVGTQEDDVGVVVPHAPEVRREVGRVRRERLVDDQVHVGLLDFGARALRGGLTERVVLGEDGDGLWRRVLCQAHVDERARVLVGSRQEAEDPLVALTEDFGAGAPTLDHRLLVLGGHGAGRERHRTRVGAEQIVDALLVDKLLVDAPRGGGVRAVVPEDELQLVGVPVAGLDAAVLVDALDGQLVGVLVQLAEVGVVASEAHRAAELDRARLTAAAGRPAVAAVARLAAVGGVAIARVTASGTAR